MTKGYVNILKNPSMPGIVKIGKTTRSVEQRCNELWQTGVPTPFEVVDQVLSPDCDQLELWMHEQFHASRVNSSREFFSISEEAASVTLDSCLRQQVEGLVEEFYPNATIVDQDLNLNWIDLYTIAGELEVEARDVVMAMNYLTAEELQPALLRYNAKVQARQEARQAGLPMPPLWNDQGATIQ